MTKRKHSRLTPKEARSLIRRIRARPSKLTIGGVPIGNDDGVLVDAAVALRYLTTELRGLRKKVELAAATTTDPATASRLRAALSVGAQLTSPPRVLPRTMVEGGLVERKALRHV